jgi:hypothetical protein
MGHNFTLRPKVGLVCDLKGKLKGETNVVIDSGQYEHDCQKRCILFLRNEVFCLFVLVYVLHAINIQFMNEGRACERMVCC